MNMKHALVTTFFCRKLKLFRSQMMMIHGFTSLVTSRNSAVASQTDLLTITIIIIINEIFERECEKFTHNIYSTMQKPNKEVRKAFVFHCAMCDSEVQWTKLIQFKSGWSIKG
ncbi:hypothetical protein CRG98_014202 [Punica granatum]|uniref:Uncharacterized protein n=1 Tax=Punica granatum TaxID=22663 RepID=A0A2I0KC94_PUNGR|nr:hypothetical protein CRG98_014202 [Punica granatum]